MPLRRLGLSFSMLGADVVLGIAAAHNAVTSNTVAMSDRRKRAAASAYHAHLFNPFQPGKVRRAVNQGRAGRDFREEVPINVSVHISLLSSCVFIPVVQSVAGSPNNTVSLFRGWHLVDADVAVDLLAPAEQGAWLFCHVLLAGEDSAAAHRLK